jgi:hypothetical protein
LQGALIYQCQERKNLSLTEDPETQRLFLQPSNLLAIVNKDIVKAMVSIIFEEWFMTNESGVSNSRFISPNFTIHPSVCRWLTKGTLTLIFK